ncbi:tetratricopeptide repeat protein [Streptomyces bauhiniae]|uniref:Tetratricopeptide repeat protein n=1 Tax=Streptomyces bauhiniae TaxID=2340725 RepID=A0A7K3QVZ1_9ACTN|nr:tetratricopeptide repeat protein [Streptomyces bauhiniae]NEB94019.1 hypothetical protein [Streptomyces bauhiniae]
MIEFDPTPRANRGHGEAFRRARRYEEALADLDRAIELDSDDAWSLASSGQTNRQMESNQEAPT